MRRRTYDCGDAEEHRSDAPCDKQRDHGDDVE
jgi:hypothetical protein